MCCPDVACACDQHWEIGEVPFDLILSSRPPSVKVMPPPIGKLHLRSAGIERGQCELDVGKNPMIASDH